MSEADVLYVEDLAYRYGKTEVFAGASLSLRAGEVAFLTGPNGAGKSTLLRCLAGWDAPAEGTVREYEVKAGSYKQIVPVEAGKTSYEATINLSPSTYYSASVLSLIHI